MMQKSYKRQQWSKQTVYGLFTMICMTSLVNVPVVRDRSIFNGGLGPVHFKFSVWKKSKSYLKRNQTKNTSSSMIILAKKLNLSYRFLHLSQPPMNIDLSLRAHCGEWLLNGLDYRYWIGYYFIWNAHVLEYNSQR